MKAMLQSGPNEQVPVQKQFSGSFIDLFCGCGGFTLGMQRAGFQCLAAIDFNAEAVATFKANFPEIKHALERDLTAFKPEELLTRHLARNGWSIALELIGNPSLN